MSAIATPFVACKTSVTQRLLRPALALFLLDAAFLCLFFFGHHVHAIGQYTVMLPRGEMLNITYSFPIMAVLIILSALFLTGHYRTRRSEWFDMRNTILVVAGAAVFEIISLFSVTIPNLDRQAVLLNWLLLLLILPPLRISAKYALSLFDAWQRPTVIFGPMKAAKRFAQDLQDNRYLGYGVTAIIDPITAPDAPQWLDMRTGLTSPYTETLEKTLAGKRGMHVFVLMDEDTTPQMNKRLTQLCRRFPDISIVPPIAGLPFHGAETEYLFRQDNVILHLRNRSRRLVPSIRKRLFDIIVGTAALAFWALPMLLLYVLVAMDGGAPIYAQTRLGRGGRRFRCYKFRTMVPDADAMLADILRRDPAARREWEADRKLRNDPRITRIGQFLRRTSLDELPQLFNVIKGDMSLVGPRPITEDELITFYKEDSCFYLVTRPGLTGLWQVSGRNDINYAERVRLDSWYARNQSFFLDVMLLVKTIAMLVSRKGAY